MTALTAESHANAIANIFPRLGRVRSTAEIVAALRASKSLYRIIRLYGRYEKSLADWGRISSQPEKMYRDRSWSFTIDATICFTYAASMRKTFSGPDVADALLVGQRRGRLRR